MATTADRSAIDSLLKEVYSDEDIAAIFNEECRFLEMASPAIVDWQGRRAMFDVQLTPEAGQGARGETGALPSPRHSSDTNGYVYAKQMYGVFQLSYMALMSVTVTLPGPVTQL
jgi:hypothetical protein